MVVRKTYIEQIRPFMNIPQVKVITGIRRCGKSVLLAQIRDEILQTGVLPEQCISVNFESKAQSFIRSIDETYQFIRSKSQKKKLYLFLDEIQTLEGWERLISACLIDFDSDIYLTGSNAHMLSGDLATHLGGRYVEIKIYPFSFAEVMETEQEQQRGNEAESFLQYVQGGGMPFLYDYGLQNEVRDKYLSDVFDSIILKDITQRYAVRDIDMLQRLILYFVANTGNTFSASALVKYLKNEKRGLSTETVYNYIGYCKNACLLHLVSRENIEGKKILQFQEKIYLADHGFREALFASNTRSINQVLENIVYMELLRQGWTVRVGKCGEKEIDFAAEKRGSRLYVQVAYLLESDETVEREFSPLEAVRDNFPKFVVSMDEINRGRNGIRHMNVRAFLLSGLKAAGATF